MVNVTFWGVRGSTPCPSEANRRYGGNTACVTIDAPGTDPIILDLGTGLRFFGDHLLEEPFRGIALVTHLHWDHVQGLPFFAPINRIGAELTVFGRDEGGTLAEAFDGFMRPPYFPVTAGDLYGDISFVDVVDTEFEWGGARIMARDVPHTGPTNGYRIEVGGVTIAYVSDHQQPTDGSPISPAVLELCRDADLVIHDAQFEPHEFAAKSEWGHCTVEFAVQVAAEAGARRLALFHHDPAHTDDVVDRLLAEARDVADGTSVTEVIAAAERTAVALSPEVVPAH